MRYCGRDTFISFNELFLIPGLFNKAKANLINYSSVMRHGFIPNLLDMELIVDIMLEILLDFS